ncbi:hypothetical protein AB2L28_07575 [Kineococcus sp. TBRC 1896]|uniref:STAS domain-containing protein n=1 Tax=Kineococcus mangrovi TaxID=1660183 RepID=A0ABV4I091_9ACTN
MEFAVSCDRRPGFSVVRVSGGLSAETGCLVLACAEVALRWSPHLVVDLCGATSADGCVPGVLAELRDRARRSGGRVSTTNDWTVPPVTLHLGGGGGGAPVGGSRRVEIGSRRVG